MTQEERSYEQLLETMNEQGLRAECVRLKKELDVIRVEQLTQTRPILLDGLDIEDVIDIMKRQMRELEDCDSSHYFFVHTLEEVLNKLLLVVEQIGMDIQGAALLKKINAASEIALA